LAVVHHQKTGEGGEVDLRIGHGNRMRDRAIAVHLVAGILGIDVVHVVRAWVRRIMPADDNAPQQVDVVV
jgi:hypothetical protein